VVEWHGILAIAMFKKSEVHGLQPQKSPLVALPGMVVYRYLRFGSCTVLFTGWTYTPWNHCIPYLYSRFYSIQTSSLPTRCSVECGQATPTSLSLRQREASATDETSPDNPARIDLDMGPSGQLK
jgi:hypothetical protein